MLSTEKTRSSLILHKVENARWVIFNADDLGLSAACNAGIQACHERGLVKSTSLMAGGIAFEEAVAWAKAHPSLDVGVHLALCDSVPVSDPGAVRSLIHADGHFPPNFLSFLRQFMAGRVRLDEVELELRAQLRKVLATGIEVSHLDSHQHLHALPAIFEIVARLAHERGIPVVRCATEEGGRDLRHFLKGRVLRVAQRAVLTHLGRSGKLKLQSLSLRTSDHFVGFLEMGRWNLDSLRVAIATLRPGVTEICCHPRFGELAPPNLAGETEVLTSPILQQLLADEGVRVTSFREYFRAASN